MASTESKTTQTVYVGGRQHVVPDLSHHLSWLARNREASPLKSLFKYLKQPGIIQLAGGTPHPDIFPYDTLSAKVLAHDSFDTMSAPPKSDESTLGWFWNLIGLGGSKPRTEDLVIPKYAEDSEAIQLSTALQYSTAQGLPALNTFLMDFMHKVHKPYLPTTAITVTTGNTDAWNRVVETLCNDGDGLLVEEWSYPSALFTSRPHGVHPVPIAMDGQGMCAEALERTLKDWDEKERGFRRPHVMYLVPVGQNPSGATMGVERKKAIYEICVKYDIIIVEDDPYFFLQEGVYVPPAYRSSTAGPMKPEEWIDGLCPSFLQFDYEGRVIRLDTFSKTIAPGARLGWITCSPLFADKTLRVGEVSTQAPCGFGQAMVTQLLTQHWGYDKYIRWLQGLQKQYTDRRNLLLDHLLATFDISEEHDDSFLGGNKVYVARDKRPSWALEPKLEEKKGKDTWFTFIPPTSGMFIWVRIHLVNHPAYRKPLDDPISLEAQLFEKLARSGLLVGPGWIFSTRVDENIPIPPPELSGRPIIVPRLSGRKDGDPSGDPEDHDDNKYAHFRLAFASASDDEMTRAMVIFSTVLRQFFKDGHL